MPELYNPDRFLQRTVVGGYIYILDGALPPNAVVPNAATYRRYKITNLQATEFALVSNDKYWRPFTPDDLGFYLLPNNAPAQLEVLRQRTNRYAGEKKATAIIAQMKLEQDNPGIKRTWPLGSGDIYIATETTVDFSVLRWKQPNPYSSTSIRVWIKSGSEYSNTTETGTTFWYNQVTKSFLVIPILMASDGTTQSQYQLSIREGKILAAIAGGLSRKAATEKVDSAGTGANGGGGATGGATSSNIGQNNSTQRESVTKVKVRGNFGYLGVGEKDGTLSQMVQMFSLPEDILPRTARHIFTVSPNQISYSNIGSDWREIERVGQVPLVDWNNYKLLKISFQFLIVPDKSETYGRLGGFSDSATNASITTGIDKKLRNLRAMATRPYPVALFGFDDMLTNQLRFPSDKGRGVEFVISDLNISSVFRTESGEINRATCDITLQEVPLEAIRIIEMPKLIPQKIRTIPEPDEDDEYGERRKFTTDLADPVLTKNIEVGE